MTRNEFKRESGLPGYYFREMVKPPAYPKQMFHEGINMRSDLRHLLMQFGMRRRMCGRAIMCDPTHARTV